MKKVCKEEPRKDIMELMQTCLDLSAEEREKVKSYALSLKFQRTLVPSSFPPGKGHCKS